MMLDFFFEPKVVAFVGISANPEREIFNPLLIAKKLGYQGKLYGINFKGGMIKGEKLYRSLKEIPEPVDLAVVTVPRESALETVKDCIAVGVKGIVIVAQGFADADAAGKAIQEEITRLAKESGVRIIGPNSMGITNTFIKFCTGFVNWNMPQPKEVGVVSQTGALVLAGLFMSGGVGLVMDLANTADVSFAEVIEYYDQDPRIKVIALYMEDIKEGREFIKTASKVSRRKPIVAIKAGVSEAGKSASASHCGALATEAKVYSAAFAKTGVIQVKNTQELNDLCKAFLYYPPLKNNRVAVFSPAGGCAIMAIDDCAVHGLEIASLAPETLDCLGRYSPAWFKPSNPLDHWMASMTHGYPKVLQELMEALMVDPNVDAVIGAIPACEPATRDNLWGETLYDIVIPIARKKIKPVLFWLYSTNSPEYIDILDKNELLGFTVGERAARAIAALYQYGSKIHNRIPTKYSSITIDSKKSEKIKLQLQNGSPWSIASLLKEYGIPVVTSLLAPNLKSALISADTIGYPVVLKVFSPEISHKSDMGGVKLNIKNADELQTAYEKLITDVKKKTSGVLIQEIIIQPYLPEGVEVLLGIKQDPQFGPVIIYGSGGIYTEIMADVNFKLAPLNSSEAYEMVINTRSYPLLKGVRGLPPADIDSLIQAIVRIGQLATDFPEIKELDLNPLMVYQQGVRALDVRVVIK